jgi:hypothetical protein
MCIINVKVNFLSVFLVRCLELGFKFESLKVRKRVKLAVESTTKMVAAVGWYFLHTSRNPK